MKKFVVCALAGLLSSGLLAQTSPFVDPKVERLLIEEISGDLAYENERLTTQWHKPSASEGFFAVARYVESKAKEYGLSDVRWIDQVAEEPGWTCRSAEAWLIDGEGADAGESKIASYAEVATSIADNSRPADVTAELVDAGWGDKASDYDGKDVRGKIVLARGDLAAVMEQAVWKRGALGILSWASSRLAPLADSADQVAWLHVPIEDGPKAAKTTFAFVLSARAGQAVSDRLSGAGPRRIFSVESKAPRGPLFVRVVVRSSFQTENRTAMVEARVPGTDPSLPEVVLTAHLQEEKFSANDDQSGVANVLEIGRALTRLIAEGKLPKPRRGIRFWWADEIYSEYRYFADHPGDQKKFLANLNQDMVGARQSIGGRIQYMARTPWSLPSYLSDVQESILDMVVAGNSGYLAAWQAGSIPPGVGYSKPILSRLGSREPFHARAVPYFDSTDHLVFDDHWVGVPGTTLTNWPDEYIHSSDDDLWQIDRTQLKRNAFIVAATAWWLANAGPSEVPMLVSFVAARGAERLAQDLATAEVWARDGKGSPAERSRAAADLLRVSLETQVAAVESVRAIGPVSAPGSPSSAVADGVAMLRAAGESFAGRLGAPAPGSDSALERLAAKTPRLPVSTLSDWMALEREVRAKRKAEARAKRDAKEKQDALRKTGKAKKTAAPAADEEKKLSPLMKWEVMNWIDGRTTADEIARRVASEALSAGWWYYGETTPAMIEKFLEEQARDGLVVW